MIIYNFSMSKIVVGMSGGVDSAVTAHILKEQGHEVIGVFMRNWDSAANNDILGNPNKDAKICPEEQEWNDVVELGKQIGIPVHKVDFIKEYWDDVFENLISEYKKGRTPNPDILCNKYVKFGAFHKWVNENFDDVDFIATGHYADIKDGVLHKPADAWKDQTYFLSQLTKEQLKQALFPLSKYEKDEVRKIATDNKLIVADKKDSTGICFVGERDFAKFLQNYIPAQPGNIVDIITNEVVGKHIGAMYYTIGQRKGLHLGGMEEHHYVVGHDMDKKIIYVAPVSNRELLVSDECTVTDMNWNGSKDDIENIEAKFRYKSEPINVSLKWDGEDLIVSYPKGYEAVTPGQQAVFYQGDKCLGGGIIDKVFKDGKRKSYV